MNELVHETVALFGPLLGTDLMLTRSPLESDAVPVVQLVAEVPEIVQLATDVPPSSTENVHELPLPGAAVTVNVTAASVPV